MEEKTNSDINELRKQIPTTHEFIGDPNKMIDVKRNLLVSMLEVITQPLLDKIVDGIKNKENYLSADEDSSSEDDSSKE